MADAFGVKTCITYRVSYADTDQMGMVYYANYLVYFERTRTEILRKTELPYHEMERRGLILPVIEAHCEYKRPAYYDDLLELCGWFEPVSAVRWRARCEVWRENSLLATGYTMHVCLDAKTHRPQRLPPALTGNAA